MKTVFSALIITLFFMSPNILHAQAAAEESEKGDKAEKTDPQTELEVETLYDTYENKEEKKRDDEQVKRTQERVQDKEFTTLSELSELSPFSDVAVIQKRFMPKTSRFEFSADLGNTLNNAFFNNWGTIFRTSYFFNEYWGIEAMYYWLNSSMRDVTKNLEDKQKVETRSLVVPERYMGLAAKWIPVYGKIAWFNRHIVPFDLYFNLGAGTTQTRDGSATTFQFSGGQMFFVSKSWGVRWDLAVNNYTANILERDGLVTVASQKNQTDLFLSLGFSFYWPEATYR